MEIEKDSNSTEEEIQVLLPSDSEVGLTTELRDVNLEFNNLNVSRSPEKALYFSIIQTAVEDYLFFGVRGKQSCNVEEFLSAYNYLFLTKSYDKETWFSREPIETESLTDDQIKLQCFDVHFDYASLGAVIKKPVLLTLLKNKRQKAVEENYGYMVNKMNSTRRCYQKQNNKKVKIVNFDKPYLSKILVEPTEISLCKLYFGE